MGGMPGMGGMGGMGGMMGGMPGMGGLGMPAGPPPTKVLVLENMLSIEELATDEYDEVRISAAPASTEPVSRLDRLGHQG